MNVRSFARDENTPSRGFQRIPKVPGLFPPKVANGKFQNVFPLRLAQKRSVSRTLSLRVFLRVRVCI